MSLKTRKALNEIEDTETNPGQRPAKLTLEQAKRAAELRGDKWFIYNRVVVYLAELPAEGDAA